MADGTYDIYHPETEANVVLMTDGSTLTTAIGKRALKEKLITATLSPSSWVGAEAPYTYDLTVNGVTATNIVEVLPAANPSEEELAAYQSANLQDGGQKINTITLKAYGEKPEISISIRILVGGDPL